jgi:hypothetical protein
LFISDAMIDRAAPIAQHPFVNEKVARSSVPIS